MKLPPKLTRQLCKATCDKKDWDKRALKLCKAFREVNKCLGPCPSHNTATKNNCLTAIPLRLFLAQYLFSIFMQQKSPTPQPPISAKPDLSMRLQGLEPWTNRLRVYCSTN